MRERRLKKRNITRNHGITLAVGFHLSTEVLQPGTFPENLNLVTT